MLILILAVLHLLAGLEEDSLTFRGKLSKQCFNTHRKTFYTEIPLVSFV